MPRKPKETQEEQSRQFMETARELECESGEAFEKAIHEVATAEPPKERKSEMTWYIAYSLLPVLEYALVKESAFIGSPMKRERKNSRSR
jgi:hypothetical protein